MKSLNDLLSAWVKRHHNDKWREDVTWTVEEYAEAGYHYSTLTQSKGTYEASIVGRDVEGWEMVRVEIVDGLSDLMDKTFSMQKFLADLFEVSV